MESKRRQQQQLCVQTLHHQQLGGPCGAPLGYPTSPWVLWDAGPLMEAARRRKKRKRLLTACLLAGVAIVVLAVAGVAGLAVYLGGSPPTESSAKWESFRRSGEARYGEDFTTHRVLGRHGVLVRADPPPPDRTTQPSRSPWSIRREESVSRWEGRGQGGERDPLPGAIPREAEEGEEEEERTGRGETEEESFPEDYSEGVPEVEVVLDSGTVEPLGDGSEAVQRVQGKPHRSPHARASDVEEGTAAGPRAEDHVVPTTWPPEVEDAAGSTGVDTVTTISVVESSVRQDGSVRRDDGKGSGVLRRNERRRGEGEREEANFGGAPPEGSSEEEEEDESVEGIVEEDKRRGGEERRYEQLQVSNKAASGGVPVFNILTKVLNRVNTSSGHKELENQDKKHAENGTMECSIGEFQCAVPNGGIMCLPASSRCDGARDCFLNGEDEIGCTCADTLRSRFLHRKLCDGVPDCWDYSDEDQCDWCSPGHLVCGGGARTCVAPERICDGVKDCPGGDDESRCIALSPEETHKEPKMLGSDARRFYHRGSNWNGTTRGSDYVTASMVTNEVLPYRSSGYLLVRKKGIWGKLCMDSTVSGEMKSIKNTKEKNWGVADIGHEVCKAMTHKDFDMIEQVTDDDVLEGLSPGQPANPYYELRPRSSQNDILGSTQSLQTTDCSSKKVMKVICRDLECGVRPKVRVNQWSRIVGGGNAAPGAWPWQAALYREGEFQCGATLISDHWLVSAGHCFFRAPDDYWVARLGTLRRGTALPSPHEQRRPVSTIILHPRYVDEGFLNDIALLRLSSPVEITDHVRPICLPQRATHIPISTYHYPESTTNPSSEEKDVGHVNSGEGTSYLYDEVMSTFPPILSNYDGIQVEISTDSPYAHHNLEEYTPTVVEEKNDTSSFNFTSHKGPSTKETTFENYYTSTKDGHVAPAYSTVEYSESESSSNLKSHSSHFNIDDEKLEEVPIMPTLPHSGDTENRHNNVILELENSTTLTDSFIYDMSEKDTTNDYITEPIVNQAVSMSSPYVITQPVTEEIDLKDLIREVSSLFLSTNSRPMQNNPPSSSMNTIHTSGVKVKNAGSDSNMGEPTKITTVHSQTETTYQSHHVQTKPISLTTKNVPANPESPVNTERVDIISDGGLPEFIIRNFTGPQQLKNKYVVDQPMAQKQSSESGDTTTPSALTFKEIYDKYSNHVKSPHETANVFLPKDKFIDVKHVNRTNSLPPLDGDLNDHKEENPLNVKYFPSGPVSVALEDVIAKSIAETISLEDKERQVRDVDKSERADEGADDGIRNGRLCTVVGWGQLFEVGKIFPDTLQEVELPLISTAECRKRTVFLPLYHLTDAMFCAGYDNGGRDACLGDSGGPLMCQETDGHWSLYGVTSNGYGCARVNRPGVYTKVSHYIPWMEEAMAKEDLAMEEEKKGEEEGGVGEEGWRQRWEWRRRRGEEQGVGGKHYCPHRCPLGECLQKARVCNGVVDCSDASDEQSCHGDVRVGR